MGSPYQTVPGWPTSPKAYFGATPKIGLEFAPLIDEIEALTAQAKSKIGQIRSKGSAMSIGDMFDLQMAMNKLQQFSELSTSVISSMNTSINSMARNIKS